MGVGATILGNNFICSGTCRWGAVIHTNGCMYSSVTALYHNEKQYNHNATFYYDKHQQQTTKKNIDTVKHLEKETEIK